jgi:glutaredoxin
MSPLGYKLFDAVDRLAARADVILDRVRKKPRRRLGAVPEPIEAPDPFTTADVPAAEEVPTPEEVPLGDVSIAAQVYGKRTDMWSGRANRLLAEHGVDARFIDLDDPDQRTFEMRLVRDTKQYELPWVFLRGEFIGGYNALDELTRLGQLEERVLPPGDRPAARKRRVKIVTPAPPTETLRATELGRGGDKVRDEDEG